jgi:hypothetical protein
LRQLRNNKTKNKIKIVSGREKSKSLKPSSGDCVNRLAHVLLLSETTGRQTDGSAGCTKNAQHAPSEMIRSSRVRMEAWRQCYFGEGKTQ